MFFSDMKKVLIIEDDPDWQEKYKRLLSENNFFPMNSPNYNDAKGLLHPQSRHHFAAAVLDLKLSKKEPGYGGIYLLEDLIWLKQIPVFVISGYVDRRTTTGLQQVGVSYVWNKAEWNSELFVERLKDTIVSGPTHIQELRNSTSLEQFQRKLRQVHRRFLQHYTILMPVETRLRTQIVRSEEELHKLAVCESELGQSKIQSAISQEINRLQRQVGHYQTALNEIFEVFPDLDQAIRAIELNRIAEDDLQGTWLQLESILIEVKHDISELKGIVEDLEQDVSEGTVDVSHKLKMAIPIIPFLLYYEGEMGISLKTNLNRLWQSVKGWR